MPQNALGQIVRNAMGRVVLAENVVLARRCRVMASAISNGRGLLLLG
jgi:hypothetical protein